MTEQNNGGPAFPCDDVMDQAGKVHRSGGMSLRDYTAIKAMSALISTSGGPCIVGGLGGAEPEVAKAAYKMADAMLEARK